MTRDQFVSECFEKVYRPTDLIAMTTDGGSVVDITLHDLLNTLGLTDEPVSYTHLTLPTIYSV